MKNTNEKTMTVTTTQADVTGFIGSLVKAGHFNFTEGHTDDGTHMIVVNNERRTISYNGINRKAYIIQEQGAGYHMTMTNDMQTFRAVEEELEANSFYIEE